MASKDQDIKRKRLEVSSWLSQIFDEQPVPEFEINTQTIQLLLQLSKISLFNDKNARIYKGDLDKKAEEFNADAQRIRCILGNLTLSQNSFSQSGVAIVQALAQTGASLDVKDASETSYMLSMKELNAQIHEVTEKLLSERQDMDYFSKKILDVLAKLKSRQKALEVVEMKSVKNVTRNAERKEETALLKKKTEENETKIAKLKIELSKTGVRESDIHHNLVKKREKLETLENELNPLKSELQSYKSLPADLVEAKVQIEQMKRELNRLQTHMSECVGAALT